MNKPASQYFESLLYAFFLSALVVGVIGGVAVAGMCGLGRAP